MFVAGCARGTSQLSSKATNATRDNPSQKDEGKAVLHAALEGEEKLLALGAKLPSLLQRASVRVGDWYDEETIIEVLPVGSTPTERERSLAASWPHHTQLHTVVTDVSQTEVALRVTASAGPPSTIILKRDHVFSLHNLTAGLSAGALWTALRFEEARDAGTEDVVVEGAAVACKKILISLTLVVPDQDGTEGEGKALLTFWLSEQLPVAGVAKRGQEVTVTRGPEIVRWQVMTTLTRYGHSTAQ